MLIALSAASVCAMPTKEEIKRVQPLVTELMLPHVNAFNANRKSAREVGDAAFGFVKDAQSEAEKYVLFKGAIYYYSLARDFNKVADALEAMRGQISELPLDEVVSIASKALARAGKGGAQRLRDIQRVASEQMKAIADIAYFKSELRKKPGDAAAMRGLAEAYVRFGDWPRALKVFAALGVEAAIYERNLEDAKDCNALKAADYWWKYSTKNPTPYRAHAATLYHKAIDEGLVNGLMKTIVENRIAETETTERTGVSPVPNVNGQDSGSPNGKLYCIVDLSPGPNTKKYSVSYLSSVPVGGWTDLYKTTRLVLRRIEPGTFIMGENQKDESHRVTFSQPFYIGVFEVTQKQYQLVTGDNPSQYKGDIRPVDSVSYSMIRGTSSGSQWPASSAVDMDSFVGKFRARTGLAFDLPTEAQWEYACRAGTTSAYNNGGGTEDDLKKLGRFTLNQKCRGWEEPVASLARHKPDGKGGYMEYHTSVGTYRPNIWGLYDMHGNVWEWCLDWYDRSFFGNGTAGPSSGSDRVRRGGAWLNDAQYCRSASRYNGSPSFKNRSIGFRLCCPAGR